MTSTPTPTSLAWAAGLVEPLLRAEVERLSPALARVAGYQFGWVDADGTPTQAAGKAVRPTLTLLAAAAVGAAPDCALPGAAAVECIHNFSLLHDDVLDHDETRRHRPTAWRVFGEAQALLAGDALLSLSTALLLSVEPPLGPAAQLVLTRATAELIAGQVEDLAYSTTADVSLPAVQQMAGRKTAALLEAACLLGGVLAGADPGRTQALGTFGWHVGMAFQLVDDLLGIWGRPEVTGKPVLSDLRERKKTLPVAAALAGDGPSARRLAALLATPVLEDEELTLVAKLVDEAGGRDWARREAAAEVERAGAALRKAGLTGPAVDQLTEIAAFVGAREA